mgnify:CR=1 FL=1|jgi:hypothetical protein
MAKKSLKKEILRKAEILIEDEAADAYVLYNVKYIFHDYDADVETFYVFEQADSPNSVEHHMMESLQDKLQEIDSRYRVGILFQERDPFPELE